MTRRHGGARGTDHGKGMAIHQGGGPLDHVSVGQQEGNADVLEDFCLIVCIILSVQLFQIC